MLLESWLLSDEVYIEIFLELNALKPKSLYEIGSESYIQRAWYFTLINVAFHLESLSTVGG